MGKKAISILLALAMAVSIICVSASAEDEKTALPSEGGTLTSGDYYLSGNVTLDENITIPQGEVVTIDLNGYTLTGSTDGGSVITVNGSLTLADSSGDNSGTVTGGTGTVVATASSDTTFYVVGGGVYVNSLSASKPATLTIEAGTISENTCTTEQDGNGNSYIGYGGGVYATGVGVKVTMNGGSITGNTACMGGGVAIIDASSIGTTNAEFVMNGGEISGNTAETDEDVFGNGGCGGGIYAAGGHIYLMAGTVSDNTAVTGGGIYAAGGADLIMVEAAITGNNASNKAGGVYVIKNVTTYLANSTILGNTVNREPNNLYLGSGAVVTLMEALTAGTVGVTTATAPDEDTTVQITANDSYAEASLAAFTSDNTAYTVQVNEDEDEGYLELAQTTSIYGATLTLDGSIGVNFYVKFSDGMTEEDMADYTMEFTVDGTSAGTVDFNSEAYRTVNGVKYYRYTVYVTSVQMTANIDAVLLNNGKAVDTVSGYTVKTYCDNQIAYDGSSATANLCAALLNYGGYAQEHFGSLLSPANEDLTSDPVADSWDDSLVADETKVIDGTVPTAIAGESGSQFSATLTLDSKTVIRLYFNLNEGADDVTFTVDGENLEIKNTVAGDVGYKEGYSYYVEIQVPAYHLSTAYTITVTDGTDTATITYGAYTYVNTEVQNTAAVKSLQNVCKALYFYGQAAAAYTGWQQ